MNNDLRLNKTEKKCQGTVIIGFEYREKEDRQGKRLIRSATDFDSAVIDCETALAQQTSSVV